MFQLGIFLICVIILMVYYKLWTITKYWKDRGVPHEAPWIIMGNMSKLMFKQQGMGEFVTHCYNAAESARYYGIYYFTAPTILIKDLELIKQITIKDFQTFPIPSETISESSDPLMSQILLFMTDDKKWRYIKSALSPSFTSSKMKGMFGLINNCATNLVEFLEEKKGGPVEAKNLFSKYTIDIIGNCCVGFPCNSFKDPANEFNRFSRTAMEAIHSLKVFIHSVCPTLANILKLRMLDKNNSDYWANFINKIIRSRENGVSPNDMVQLLLKIKNEQSAINQKVENDSGDWSKIESNRSQYRITDHDIVCQTLMVLIAGIETSSSTLCFAAYELSINIKIQTMLQQEIDEVLDKRGDSPLCYDDLMQMKYLDAVVSETLRKWPIATYLDRRTTKEFVVEPKTPTEKRLILEAGLRVMIPVFGVHRDPEYYPDPDKFDPERFYNVNKSNINPFTYFPFGLGPRSCLGSRLAVLEIKVALFHVLSKFNILPVKSTPTKIYTEGMIAIYPGNKFSLNFQPRK